MDEIREIREQFEQKFGVSSELDWPEIQQKLEEDHPQLFENLKPVNFFLRFLQG